MVAQVRTGAWDTCRFFYENQCLPQTNSAFHFIQEHQQDVISKCVASEPRHGPVWQSVAKDPKNFAKKTKELLELVMQKLE